MNKNGVRGVQIAVGNHFMNNTYAITKTVAERFALMFNKEFGTRIAVVRGLNAYGPGQKHKPVRKIMPNFVLRALRRQPIEIYGDGSQIMDMIHVKDLAKILLLAALEDHKTYDHVMEAGTGRATSVLQIAELANKMCGSEAGIKHLPMRAGEPPHSTVLGDPTTLQPIFPDARFRLTPLEQGLEDTIAWYKEHLNEIGEL
jgi:nucleoside-diphosphate-sugar epimerase